MLHIMNIDNVKKEPENLLNYQTKKGTWIVHNKEESFLLIKTPGDKYLVINEGESPSICLHYDNKTSIVLSEKEITIKAKKINIQSSEGSVFINGQEIARKI